MSLRKLAFVIAIIAAQNLFAVGGDWIGNGASISENRILMAYHRLDYYVYSTLTDKYIPIAPSQREALQKIYKALPDEKRSNQGQIRFEPNSNLFLIGGESKVAVTGSKVGDTIYFNKDIINRFDPTTQSPGITMLQAISILIHEMGHHQGYSDEIFLNNLGASVADIERFEVVFLKIHPRIEDVGVQVVSPRQNSVQFSTLALVDQEKFFDLTEVILRQAQCPNQPDGISKLVGLDFWNLHWKNSLSAKAEINGVLALRCRRGDGSEFDWIGDRIIIYPQIIKSNEQLLFASQISVAIDPCIRGANHECVNENNIKNLRRTL